MRLSLPFLLPALLALSCSDALDEPADPRDECATCAGGKADELSGSCDAEIIVAIANQATLAELDDDAALNRRAAENIVAARATQPFVTLEDVDDVPFVGATSLAALLDYGKSEGHSCEPNDCSVDGIILAVANQASFSELDDEIGLDRRAAEGIVAGRPFDSVAALDAVPFVGATTLARLQVFGEATGFGCAGDAMLALISDLDKTVIPPSTNDLSIAPYPGAVTLYQILLAGSDRITYVTARQPDRVIEVPAYLETHGLPGGPIETGISGFPPVAEAEKVRDITKTFEASPDRIHVLFGDSSHVDAGAFQEIIGLFPEQVHTGLIHIVTTSVPDLTGLLPFNNHVEAAAILVGEGLMTRDDARAVFDAAVLEGLALTEAEFDALLETHD